MIPPCLTLSNIRYISRVKWSNPWKGVAPSPTPRCNSYWKGSFLVTLDYGRQLFLLNHYVQIKKVSFSVHAELINVSFCWSANTDMSLCMSPQEKIIYKFVLGFPAMLSMSSYLDGLWDGRPLAEQLLFCEVLLPGFVQNIMQYSNEVLILLFLQVVC